ncbi:MAG TPA: SGNH/GDSL hydrolase family protein [Ktedonobacteraceae bacterium]|jgi:lysophospholipase L1-like esterase|nr:SGNH/GDSL hydrolase family protein [Ktedonobacteraceae bacterium]
MFYSMQQYLKFVISLLLALLLATVVSSSAFASALPAQAQFVGPKKFYLALGDSLAFGYQPNGDYKHGYAADFLSDLRHQHNGVLAGLNFSCPGENSQTFITGICAPLQTLIETYPILKKLPPKFIPKQMDLAVGVLHLLAGQVSPVTLDIGANDVLNAMDTTSCTVNIPQFQFDLLRLDTNLQLILPALHAALQVKGKKAGDLLVMNYYDPYQNRCPNLVSYTQEINALIARDVAPYATLVDVFSAFGGAETPNPNICSYTWICSTKSDIHASSAGYQAIARAFEQAYGY